MNKELAIQLKGITEKEIKSAMGYCIDYDNCNQHCPFSGRYLQCQGIFAQYVRELESRDIMSGTETYIITNKGNCYTVEAWKNGQKQTAEFKDMQKATEWIEKLKGE